MLLVATTAPSGCEYSSDEGERSDADAFDLTDIVNEHENTYIGHG